MTIIAEKSTHCRSRQVSRALQGLLLGSAMAVAAEGLPPVQTSGEVRFITGGVGQVEAEAIKRERSRYPLVVEVYAREGGREVYTADVRVIVQNRRGETLLDERTQGPFLLADVPPGRYTVQVERLGQTQRKSVSVGDQGSMRRVFVFGRPEVAQ